MIDPARLTINLYNINMLSEGKVDQAKMASVSSCVVALLCWLTDTIMSSVFLPL